MRKGATLSGEHLREKAVLFWSKLSIYQGQEQPAFLSGWLDGFKSRHNIKGYTRHGKAGYVKYLLNFLLT